MARRPSGVASQRVGRRLAHPGQGSRFRGPLLGASDAGADAPAQMLNHLYGRQRIEHVSFHRPEDVAAASYATAVAINVGTGAIALVSSTTTSAYWGFPVGLFTTTSANGTGIQQAWGPAATHELFSSLAGGTARAYDPPLVINWSTELSSDSTSINNAVYAIGLIDRDAAVLDNAGANVAAGNGLFFRIPQGAAGVSGAIQCIWNANGANQSTTTTTQTLTSTAASAGNVRLGIRITLRGLTAAAAPVMSAGSSVEFYINDQRVATVFGNDTRIIPLGISPWGITLVRIAGAANIDARVPYWAISVGPVRSGPTTA